MGMGASPGSGLGSYRVVVSSGQMIDWELAISTGVRWVRPGPQVSLAEARAVVSELHALWSLTPAVTVLSRSASRFTFGY